MECYDCPHCVVRTGWPWCELFQDHVILTEDDRCSYCMKKPSE